MATKTNHSVASILGIGAAERSNIVSDPPRHRQRRNRTLFNDSALDTLEQSFQTNQYPDINQREQLAESVGVTEARIQVWFQNRRSRLRRNKGAPTQRCEKPVESPSPPKTTPSKPQPLATFTPRPQQMANPLNYPNYMFGYSILYPSAIHPSAIHPLAVHPSAIQSHYPDLVGYSSSSPNSPLWSPTSPNYMKFFDSPASPRYNTISTPLKTMFPFTDVSPARQNYTSSLYTGGLIATTTPMKIPLKMAPLDLSDWSSSESRHADIKNNSGTSLESANINVSTSSDDENSK
ncbi:paired box protein Pax-3-like [Gigantopelta aegis]|uniref:paired box protein Pax-3-like n=1 Tax=Gigantopelta aegis TaxID=1735272 RepID=UPI001B888FF3|nr:paired box protein Pax-3-like [Gigantopelta aegis]